MSRLSPTVLQAETHGAYELRDYVRPDKAAEICCFKGFTGFMQQPISMIANNTHNVCR